MACTIADAHFLHSTVLINTLALNTNNDTAYYIMLNKEISP